MAENSLQLGQRQIDLSRGQIREGSTTSRLTTRELALLRYLVEHSGEVVTREQMLTDVWGYSKDTDTRTVYATLHNLRKKIEADSKNPQWLTTAHGAGYQFHMPRSSPSVKPYVPSPDMGTTIPWTPPYQVTANRVSELIDSLNSGTRALGLVGPVGVGKTRLLYAILEAWPGAFRWCSLDGVQSMADVVVRLAQALGLSLDTVEASDAHRLAGALAGFGPVLIGLDGLDGVSSDMVEVLEEWVERLSEVRWVWTSQKPLDTTVHRTVVVRGLTGLSGVRFLVERAQAAGANGLDASDPNLHQIVSRVDGNPLVLSLLAPRLRSGSSSRVAQRLEGDELQSAIQADRARKILNAHLAASWRRLSAVQRQMLSVAALFRGSVSVASLQALCDTEDVESVVDELVDQSLLIPEANGSMIRYRLLRPLRWYVRSLAETSEPKTKFIAWLQAQVEQAYAQLWERSCPFRPWTSYNPRTEEVAHVVHTWVAYWEDVPDVTRAKLTLLAAEYWLQAGPRSGALEVLDRAKALELPDILRCEVWMMRSVLLRSLRRFAEAKDQLHQAYELAMRRDLTKHLARCHSLSAFLHVVDGSLDVADQSMEKAMSLLESGQYNESHAMGMLGFLRWRQRRLTEAKQLFQNAIDRVRLGGGGPTQVPAALYAMMGLVMADLGEDPTQPISKGLLLATRWQFRQDLLNLLLTRSYWRIEAGEIEGALEDLEWAYRAADTMRGGVMPRIRFQMALAYFCDGRLNEVERVFQRWLDEGGGESADQKSAFQLSALMSIAYRLMEQDEKAESLRDIAKDYLSTLNVPEMNHVLALCDWTLGGDSPKRAELHVGINTRLWMNEVGSVVRRFRGSG